MKPKLRSRARAAALQILYQMDLGTDEDEAYQHVMDHFGTPPLDSGYLRRLLDGVSSQREALAERLEQANPQWRQDRQDVVDRNLLLMSAFELVEGTAPLKVVLTEAGLLAERYGSDRSAQFVRGTLGRLAEGLTG
ncbi:MAG: transcription antitermination protein NusB [Myxococcota bacterium]|nr:transcription antitermination protein NusB [Myxococcota bacterium]